MNYTLLIDKYQPLFFKDFEIDTSTINFLNLLIQSNNLLLLFLANSGSGKTTLLNAVLREYYKNYDNYESNILKINNIKEYGITYYRTDFKTFCQTCSNIKNKKKTIVLDDLDTINEQIQQVIRNCIDKYKNNVNFICSCNNIQKVIESLKTRLHIINIEPLSKNTIKNIYLKIKNSENIDIENEEVENFILSISNNNSKVLINYIEKFKLLNKKITLEIAKNICSHISFFTLEEYITFIKNYDLKKAIQIVYNIYDKGYSTIDILDSLFSYVKVSVILNDNEKYIFIEYICKYISIFYNINENIIELVLFTNDIIQELKKMI